MKNWKVTGIIAINISENFTVLTLMYLQEEFSATTATEDLT
jgi:hypothetical protein